MEFREGAVLKKVTIQGNDVVFRFPKRGDEQDLLGYINSLIGEGARILMRKKATLKEEREWLEGKLKEMRKGTGLMVCIEIRGQVIGNGQLRWRMRPPSAQDHVAELAFGIRKEFRRLGITETVIRLLFDVGREHGLEIVRSSYMSDNPASERLHNKMGFQEIGRLPLGGKYGKKYVDEVLVYKRLKGKN